MLYHVPDIPAAIGELRRITKPGGTVLASTNSSVHLAEIHHLLDAAVSSRRGRPVQAVPALSFTTQSGTAMLSLAILQAQGSSGSPPTGAIHLPLSRCLRLVQLKRGEAGAASASTAEYQRVIGCCQARQAASPAARVGLGGDRQRNWPRGVRGDRPKSVREPRRDGGTLRVVRSSCCSLWSWWGWSPYSSIHHAFTAPTRPPGSRRGHVSHYPLYADAYRYPPRHHGGWVPRSSCSPR